ncbi:heparinase II/III family protein [Paenibacillus sp. RC67]|uniref:heparinase II/III domain-containing protein n=1 Tax=Paenibacillus sp. RC67 TaxID=3039392 RepID=UPI0024AC90AF|nr:heparinase II/III family protein [Paenibacillus sp. RC67]
MFSQKVSQDQAAELLLSAAQFRPFPKGNERERWESIPKDIHLMWMQWAEERLDYGWPALPATRYMDFVKNGNRSQYEATYFDRRRALIDLVIGECLEGQGRFLEQIINGIWCLCEESYWVVPAHMSLSPQSRGYALPDVTEQVIDLFAAETGALLAWTAYLLEDQFHAECPMIMKRVRHEMQRRIFEPYLDREDFWWMGYSEKKVNNWNPWIHSNCLAAFLILEEEPVIRSRAVAKAAHSLDTFMQVYHPDGGCDEGPSYWGRAGASLFDCLELMYWATDGKLNFYDEPLVKEIGKYIYRVHIDDNEFVNFADGDGRIKISGNLVYQYGKRIEDSKMSRLGAYAFQKNGFLRDKIASPMRILSELMDAEALLAQPLTPPYERDIWLPDTHIFAARETAGQGTGLYLAAKGGHNDESHNHNDIGHCIVYYNGFPFLIDAGVESYTAKTFSPQRYEIWTMQSAYHSLPTVNGVQQQAGKAFRATEVTYESNEERARVSMNIGTAYPPEAGINVWRRNCTLYREGGNSKAAVEIVDSFQLKEVTTEVIFNYLMLPIPLLRDKGIVELVHEKGGNPPASV